MRTTHFIAVAASLIAASAACAQSWVSFTNQTASRLVASPSLVVNDNLEKDFAWGDFDHDGDIDLVCMRKFPGSIQGGFRDLLLMNEGGVLTDRTTEYGSASDVAGYQGMLDPCNDRDVEAVDVNNDGWLDLVTATTMSDQVNDIVGQPRVYMNLGNNGSGSWQGFRFEDARIPVLLSRTGTAANPRFCDAAIGDFTGDGFVDIFYTDYDTPETSGQTICIDLNNDGDTADVGECQSSPAETASFDYDNRLLVNSGAANPGFFTDATSTMLSSAQIASAFGNSAIAADMNGDGKKDIVRVNTLTTGQDVGVYTKNATASGFAGPKTAAAGAPYFIDCQDLNGDGRLDIIVADDGQDKYLLNTGNDGTGQPNFTSYTIAQSLGEFGNSITSGDLDKDGRIDTIITDVDADLGPFCPTTGRRTHIYRNVYAGSPSGILVENTPPLPLANLAAWTDVAILDINGDTYLDLVAGRCSGIEVWMNVPPVTITFAYPDGLPTTAAPGTAKSFRVQPNPAGGTVVAGSPTIWWSVNGGAYSSAAMLAQSGGIYLATLPPLACGSVVRYYVSAQLSTGTTYVDPPTAPATANPVSIQSGSSVLYTNDMESASTGWTVVTNGGLTTGGWVAAVPVGATSSASGTAYATAPSADSSTVGTKAWVTQNGASGAAASSADVDAGTTRLVSATFDLSTALDATVSYARWYFCSDAPPYSNNPAEVDPLIIEGSADGGTTWVTLETVTTYPSPNGWVRASYSLRTFFPTFTANMVFRFSIADSPDNSITEAGLDDFSITATVCTPPCIGDLDLNGVVNGADMGIMLAGWGGTGNADLDGNGEVNGADLGTMLSSWGPCP